MIGFRQHGEIDLGLAAMSATMPEFMGLKRSTEKKSHGGGTDYPGASADAILEPRQAGTDEADVYVESQSA
jgi:hypothetical protein